MTRGRLITAGGWVIVTLGGLFWLVFGDLAAEIQLAVAFGLTVLLGYGPARAIAWWRTDRENPLLPRMVPLRITGVVGALIMFGPAVAFIAGWIEVLPAIVCFLGGFIAISICIALFSDGYQGFWLDSLIFRARLNPPEDDYLLKRDANRRKSR